MRSDFPKTQKSGLTAADKKVCAPVASSSRRLQCFDAARAVLVLSCAAMLVAGCRRELTVQKSDDPAALARQFTNLLVRGTGPNRSGIPAALSYLATEAWNRASFEIAARGLLSGIGDADTNISAASLRGWLSLCRTQNVPSWTVGVVSDCARRSLSAHDPRIRCAAGIALLRLNLEQTNSVSAVLAGFARAEEDLIRESVRSLAEASRRNPDLRRQAATVVRSLVEAPHRLRKSIPGRSSPGLKLLRRD